MNAIVREKYGPPDILEARQLAIPAVADDAVLVKVLAAAVCSDDWHLLRGLPYFARLESGVFKPKRRIPGLDAAGRVAAVGKDVKDFQTGDEVFGWCEGAFAEYVAVPKDALVLKPANLTFEQAASVPISGFTALQGLRDRGEIKSGHQVLINGASGGVGTFAVQIAKAFGAEVTGVCSTRNLDLVRSLGADHVIDYTQWDFTKMGKRYDLILDLAQSHSLSDYRCALNETGTLVLIGSAGIHSLDGRNRWFKGTDRWMKALFLSPFVRQRLRPLIHRNSHEDLIFLKRLIESGQVTPVVDRTYRLQEAPQAIRYAEVGHPRGKVVIAMGSNGSSIA